MGMDKMQEARPTDDLLELYGLNETAAPPKPPRRSRRKWWILAGTAAVLLAGAALAAQFAGKSEPPVTFATVDRGDIVKTISATGRLQAVQTVQVGTQISGVISALYADFNPQVKKGQVIARLDSSQLEAQLNQARANLLAAQAGEQLLQIGQRDLLPVGDLGQGHSPAAAAILGMRGQVGHRHHGVTSLGAQSHSRVP
jgi:multidrug efflux pump subunit AcrA (membrane-fusion protein)